MDHHLPDPTAGFGELFEGETAVFEHPLSGGDGLGLENGIGMGLSSLQPSTSSYSRGINIQLGQYQLLNTQAPVNANNLHFDETDGPSTPVSVRDRDPLSFSPNEKKYVPPVNHLTDEDSKCDNVANDVDQKTLAASSPDESFQKTKICVTKNADHFVRININKYFKNRGYRETLLPKTVDKKDIAEMINPELSRANSISFGPNYRADELVEEFDRFLKFYHLMKVRNPAMSLEIKPMLLPILVHFFQESYESGFTAVSAKLMTDFGRKVLQEDKNVTNCLAIMAMSMVKRKGFDGKPLKKITDRVHKFVISESTFGQLKKLLSKSKRNVLLNILTSPKFIIEIRSCREVAEAFSSSDNVEEENEISAADHSTKQNLTKAQRVLHSLRGNIKANMPSISVFTTNGQPTCGTASSEGSTFAFGLATSGIRICPASSARNLEMCESEELKSPCHSPNVRELCGHNGSVYGVKFHPKTKLLYSVGQDRVMRSWDLTNDKATSCKAIYEGHLGPIWSMDISNSGQMIATGSSDTTARIWLPERTDCGRILVGHYFDVDCVRFHPNESYLATGSVDKSVRLWSVSDGNMVRILTGMEGKVSTLAFHKSGKYIVCGGDEGMLRIWDIAEGELLAELPCLNYCKDLTFHGNMLAGCFRNGAVQLWNLRNIVGGDNSNSSVDSLTSESSVMRVPEPYLVQCHARTLTNLWYKDPGNLYCLGSDPPPHTRVKASVNNVTNTNVNVNIAPEEIRESINSITPYEISDSIPVISIPNLDSSQNDSPIYIKFNVEESPQQIFKNDTPMQVSRNISIVTAEQLLDEDVCIEDADAENTNNTITSSDMEFEVDDQMLESFVDDSNSLLQT